MLSDRNGSQRMSAIEIARSNLSMIRYRFRRRVGKRTRRVEAMVQNELARRIPSRSTVSGDVWAISMVKNEVDIIEASIRHCFDQGIDAMLIADNGSSDGTHELLIQLAQTLPMVVVRDPIVAHEQDAKMTVLANGARKLGAKWIVPFDADEFWFAKSGTLGDFLRSEKSAVVIYGDLFNAFPISREGLNVKSKMAMSNSVAVKKVAFRTHRYASLCMGSNEVYRGVPRIDGVYVLHLPWRSSEQMKKKLSQGRESTLAASNKDWAGGHWVLFGESTDEEINEIWEKILKWKMIDGLSWSPEGVRYEISGVQNPYCVLSNG